MREHRSLLLDGADQRRRRVYHTIFPMCEMLAYMERILLIKNWTYVSPNSFEIKNAPGF